MPTETSSLKDRTSHAAYSAQAIAHSHSKYEGRFPATTSSPLGTPRPRS